MPLGMASEQIHKEMIKARSGKWNWKELEFFFRNFGLAWFFVVFLFGGGTIDGVLLFAGCFFLC